MRPHPLAPCLILLAAAMAPPARADDYCVHDSAGLKQAIDRATLDWTGDSTIRLRQGTYVTSGIYGENPNNPIDNDLAIIGGYTDPDCAEAGRSLDPATTILQAGPVANLAGFYFQIDGDLLLKSITFRGYGKGMRIHSPDPDFGSDDQWTLDRVRIEGSGGTVDAQFGFAYEALSVITYGDADLTLQQVVFADNRSGDLASVALHIEDNTAVIKQSTFADNEGTALYLGAWDSGPRLDMDNNIFWGNGLGVDVRGVPAANLHVRHNTFDVAHFDAMPSVLEGNDFLDPQFLDAPGRDYRLFASSPAVDAGTNPPSGGLPASDITGGPRVIGAGVDRGAWETDVDHASVLLVTTTAASGPGSLASAIAQSNALAGLQVIRFAIPGACPQVISQFANQQLQAISDSVRIEGYSQPGSVRGAPQERTICVGLRGNQEVAALLAIDLGADPAVDVSGMGFGGTTQAAGAAAIRLLAGSNHQVAGNQFGGSIGPAGNPVALDALRNGIVAGFLAHDSVIGGLDPEQANVFNDAGGTAIDIGTTTTTPAGFRVYRNYIGLRANGATVGANGNGISIGDSAGNYVLWNWISGNTGDGIVLGDGADGNYVLANDIGRCASIVCSFPVGSESLRGNGVHGVLVRQGADDNILNGNRIAGNGFGYAEEDGANGNALVGNAIYRNTGLGIDIGRDGVTPNDNGGVAPDGVQNFPVLASAGGGFRSGTVHGSLSSPGERTYAIEIYASDACDASGFGEGQRLVGRGSVTTPPSPVPGIHSSAPFDIAIESGSLDGKAITAIARNASGSTSEFSACRIYVYSDVIFADGFDAPQT